MTLLTALLVILSAMPAKAESWLDGASFIPMRATAYCLTGTTATGTQTREGIAAGPPEWYGRKVYVYLDNDGELGPLYGSYVVEDTGGKPIRTGKVLDIWMPTREQCMNFGNRKVYIILSKEDN